MTHTINKEKRLKQLEELREARKEILESEEYE